MSNTIKEALQVFQDYTASHGYPMNQEAHEKGLEICLAEISRLLDEAKPSKKRIGQIAYSAKTIGDIANEPVSEYSSNIERIKE